MKIIVGVLLVLISLGCGSVKNGKEDDFGSLAKDSCKCVNKSLKDLSPEMIEVIEGSYGNEAKLQELMTEYAMSNPTQAMEDAKKMQGSMVDDITNCMGKLQNKYDDMYTELSEREVQKRLLEELRKHGDCKATYVFMKMGMSQ